MPRPAYPHTTTVAAAVPPLRLLWLLALLGGCPGPGDADPTADCTRLHEQCRIRDGLLGVCNYRECVDGEAAPCFECVSQH